MCIIVNLTLVRNIITKNPIEYYVLDITVVVHVCLQQITHACKTLRTRP